MGIFGIGSRNRKQEAMIRALKSKESGEAVRAFIRVAEDLKEAKTEYLFPIALNTDITKYKTTEQTPSHINICVEYDKDKKSFQIIYRIMNLNDSEMETLSEDELSAFIEENGGISTSASLAHGKNILEARLKMLLSQNKSVSDMTRTISMAVQEALISGVIPANASVFLPLVNQDGLVPVSSYGGFAEGLRVKGDEGVFDSDVSSEENIFIDHIGKTGLNRKGQVEFTASRSQIRNDIPEGQSVLEKMDRNYLSFGERDLSEYTDAIYQAILQLTGYKDEVEFLVTSINSNYEQYQVILNTPADNEEEKTALLNAMAQADSDLRNKLNKISEKSHGGRYVDFVLQDPFSAHTPRGYMLERSSHGCVIGADGKILPGFNEGAGMTVERYNNAVDEIQAKYEQDVNKRKAMQKEFLERERVMTEKHGLGVTALAVSSSDTYRADLDCLKGTRDSQLRSLAESEQYRCLFTDTYTVLDQTSQSRTLGIPIHIFINPYAPSYEQEKMIENALSLQTKGDRSRNEEVLETVKALMCDSMDIGSTTGCVSFIGMLDVYEILSEHLNHIVTIRDNGQEWTICIVKSRAKGRDFDFIDPDTKRKEDLTELFVASHLKPHVVLSTEICQGSSKTTIAEKIKGFFSGTIGEAVRNFQKSLLSPRKTQEAVSSMGILSPASQKRIKEANMAIRNAINCIRESSIARFEEYKANELNILAQKLDIASYRGAETIAEKALAADLINGDKKYNLLTPDAGERLFGNPEELAFIVASRNLDVKNALGEVYMTYENLAHEIRENVSLCVEARKNGEIAVKKDLIFPKGKMNKPILIEYEKKGAIMTALPARNITKEIAMDVIALAIEAQIYSPFQQAMVQTADEKQMENVKDINQVLSGARDNRTAPEKKEVKTPGIVHKDR